MEQAQIKRAGPATLLQMCKEHPDDLSLRVAAADRLLHLDRPHEALIALENGTEGENEYPAPQRAAMEGCIAQAYLMLNQSDAGETHLRKALDLDKGCIPACFAEGLWFQSHSAWELSETAFESVAQLDPQDSRAWFFLGKARNHAAHFNGAIAALNRALKIAPGRNPYLSELGSVYASLGDHHEAIRLFKLALQADPHDEASRGMLRAAQVFDARTAAEYEIARADLLDSLQTGQSAAAAYGLLGMLYLRFEHIPDAYAALTEAISLGNKSPDIYYDLFLAARMQGRQAEADTALRKFQVAQQALQQARTYKVREFLEPKNLSLHEALAHDYEIMGERDNALNEYRHILSLHPEDRIATSRLKALSAERNGVSHGGPLSSNSSSAAPAASRL